MLLTILLLGGFVGVGYLYADYTLQSPVRTEDVTIEIPPNTNVKEVGAILKKHNLIRDDLFFRYYAKWKKKTNIIAGPYLVQTDMNLDEILALFTSGKQDYLRVTIPEGVSVVDIAEILNKKLGTNKEAFLKEVNRTNGTFSFEKDIQPNADRKYRLEGYLFPSTYEFRKGETPKKIVDTMLKQFEKECKKNNVFASLSSRGMSLDQIVMFASIVEREGFAKDELPKIAGVIQNRIAIKMPLQVDATIVYGYLIEQNKKIKLVMLNDYDNFKSAYNLHRKPGFPPGPIGNPGIDAILAAINPAKHKYLYYVAKEDGTNTHDFSATYAEHKQKNAIAKKLRDGK